jgi:S-adenosylmethionine/arginine decarboxylase-like enzyme
MAYGNELILDLVDCDIAAFSRKSIDAYLEKVCDMINATREGLHWWDYDGLPDEYEAAPPHMKGRTAVQLISKSDIVMHAIEHAGSLFINVFSCGTFDEVAIERLTIGHFGGRVTGFTTVERGSEWSA